MNDDSLADRFTRHADTLRGVVRYEVLARQLADHLPPPPARIVDVGAGAGTVAIPLAHVGYNVTMLDISQDMLHRAAEAIRQMDANVQDRITLVRVGGEEAHLLFSDGPFDVALCHGVIMYMDDPATFVSSVVALTRPGGIISLATKNRDALAMRPALEGRYKDAMQAFEADRDIGGMGIPTQAHTLGQVAGWLHGAGANVVQWYGVRIFTDHLGDQPEGPDIEDIVELEYQAGQRDPYRSVARLIHLIAVRQDESLAEEALSHLVSRGDG